MTRRIKPYRNQIWNSGSGLSLSLFFQTNKPTVGEARQSGNSAVAAEVALSSRWPHRDLLELDPVLIRAICSRHFKKKSIVPGKTTSEYCPYLCAPWACSRTRISRHDQTQLQATFVTGPKRNIHYHLLFLDGVYIDSADKSRLWFRRVKAPTNDELTQLTHTIARRVARHLERQGLLARDTGHTYLTADGVDEDPQSPMNQLLGSSITYRIAVGPQQGRKASASCSRPSPTSL